MSLRRRFAVVLAAYAVGLAGVLGLVAWRVASDALEGELERRLLWTAGGAGAAAFAGDLALALEPGYEVEASPYRERLRTLLRYVDDAFIFDATDNTLLVGADETPIGSSLPRLSSFPTEIRETLQDGDATTDIFNHEGRAYKYGFKQLVDFRGVGTPAILAVRAPADFYAPLRRLGMWLAAGSALALLAAVAVGGVLAGGIAAPLERLSRVALRIQRGAMDEAVEVHRGDEIGNLSAAMESMRLGIQERDEQLRLMLAQVAHEIRNPLGGLELFASAAAETDDAAERRRLLARVRNEVSALNRIIDDFLTFARPLPGPGHAEDLRLAVNDAVELAEPEIASGGGSLEVQIADEPLLARADRDQVKRAVLNLLRNARQAGQHLSVEAFVQGGEVVVAVTDDGPGVPPELRGRIFEPFVTDKEKGAGLGLAIVRKVVEAQGGRVAVEDAPHGGAFGAGARFLLYFVGLEEPPRVVPEGGSAGREAPEATFPAGSGLC